MTVYTQKPLYVSKGCNRLGQCTSYYCAPHSTKQALAKLNDIDISEKTIAKVMGTTQNGTGHPQINYFIDWFNKKYKTSYKIKWINFSDLGNSINKRFEALGRFMSKKDTVCFGHILYRLEYGHYEIFREINTKTREITVFNSLGSRNKDGSYQGYVETRSFDLQAKYFRGISQPSIAIITKE